jgi:hypothetical protein
MKKENELLLEDLIEMGQLSVSSFEKVFKEVHVAVDEALKGPSETRKNEE